MSFKVLCFLKMCSVLVGSVHNLVGLTMTLFSNKMLISRRCIRGLMPNLIKKSWTVSIWSVLCQEMTCSLENQMNILSNSPIIFSLQEDQIYKNGLFVTEEFQAKLFQFYSPHFTWKTKISKVNDQKQNPTKSILILEPSCIGLGSFHKLRLVCP